MRADRRLANWPNFQIALSGSALIANAAMLAIAPGCIRVDTTPEFERTSSAIRERLGVSSSYSPSVEAIIEDKVKALLAGGMTVDEAVSVALLNNQSFQALFQTIGVAQADVVQSQLVTNPSLVFGVRFPEGGGRSELTLGLAQQLVDLWQIPVRKEVAEAQLQQTVFLVLDEAVRIAVATRSRCFDVIWRARLDAIARNNQELARRSLDLADIRLNAGEASPLEAGLVRTQLFDTQNEARRTARDLENARLDLAQVLGLARWDEQWILTGDFESCNGSLESDEQLLVLAQENRFDIQWADARLLGAEREIELQLLKIFPSLEIGLQAERTERRALPGRKILADTARASVAAGSLTAPGIESRGQRDLVRRQIIDALIGPSLQITLPIWDQNQAQIAKAQFAYVRMTKEREQLLDAVFTEVRQAANNARVAAQLVRFFESEVLPHVEANLKSAQSRYENGEDSVVVLLDAQEAEFMQKRLSADALRDYCIAVTDLAGAVGGRLPATATKETQFNESIEMREEQNDGDN